MSSKLEYKKLTTVGIRIVISRENMSPELEIGAKHGQILCI
jgi:hypothetical protein